MTQDLASVIVRITHQARAGRIREAFDQCKAILAQHPNHPDVLSLVSRLAEKTGDADLAVRLAKDAVAHSCGNAFLVGQLRAQLKRLGLGSDVDFLRTADFHTFFERLPATITPVDFSTAPRHVPDLDRLGAAHFASCSYEESQLEAGLCVAHARDLDVFYSQKLCPNIISRHEVLVERQYEIPTMRAGGGFSQMTNYGFGYGSFSPYFPSMGLCFQRDGLATQVIEEEGVYIGGAHNYGHLLLDYFPKLLSVARAGLASLPIYTFSLSDFHRQVAETLFPELRLVDISRMCSEDCLLQFRSVHVPSYVPAGVSFGLLRERMGDLGPATESWDRLYLSRGAGRSRLENEPEILELLQSRGFHVLNTMEYGFRDLARIFGNARVIVSGYGAQVSTMIFCRPGTVIVELCPKGYTEGGAWFFNNRVYVYAQIDHRILVGDNVSTSEHEGVFNFTGRFDPKELAALLPE